MKTIRIMQAFAATAMLVGGALIANEVRASECYDPQENWGYTNYHACFDRAEFQSGSKGASNAFVSANLLQSGPGWYAQIAGLNSSGNLINGCGATDASADGNSVADQTGCQNGVFVTWVVHYY